MSMSGDSGAEWCKADCGDHSIYYALAENFEPGEFRRTWRDTFRKLRDSRDQEDVTFALILLSGTNPVPLVAGTGGRGMNATGGGGGGGSGEKRPAATSFSGELARRRLARLAHALVPQTWLVTGTLVSLLLLLLEIKCTGASSSSWREETGRGLPSLSLGS